jgi:hypothetical protein
MSTTEQGDEAPGEGVELPGSARRFHALYAADLSRAEPVSDAQILAGIHRAEVHDEQDDASSADIAAHLGFVHNSWTTSGFGSRLDAPKAAAQIRDVRRNGLDLLALTDAVSRAGFAARAAKSAMRSSATPRRGSVTLSSYTTWPTSPIIVKSAGSATNRSASPAARHARTTLKVLNKIGTESVRRSGPAPRLVHEKTPPERGFFA